MSEPTPTRPTIPGERPVYGVAGIAAYLHEELDAKAIRRVRYLLAAHNLPHVQKGRRIWSFPSWLDAYMRG